MAKVQVLIPCYNYARYLEQCVQSVLDQPGVDIDVLVIDDCSSDETPAVCKRLTDRDPRVRVIRHAVNIGHIATYNEGISDIRGDYFVLLSADDLLTPGALARATSIMEANPKVGMVYGQPLSFTGELPAARMSVTGTSVWNGRTWMRHVCRSGKNFVICPEAVVRASIQRQIGGYNKALPHSADMEMWLRIAAICDIGRVRGADQAYYRVHDFSMQRTVHAGFLFDLTGRREAFRSALAKEGAALPERDELWNLARRALALIAVNHARKLCGHPDDNDAAPLAYREFAVSLWPEVVATLRYRALLAAERQDKSSLRMGLARGVEHLHALFDKEIVNRAEWHLARRTGIYFPRYYF